MLLLTSGITNINQLFNYAGFLTTSIRAETDQIMRDRGLLIGNLDLNQSLSAITSAAIADANATMATVRANNPELPEYRPYSFTPPPLMEDTIASAMAGVRYVQGRLAEDPNWEGDPTRATLNEERDLELRQRQNALMVDLTDSIRTLNSNTAGLPDLLQDMVDNQNTQTNIFQNLLTSFNGFQEWLMRLEQAMTNQASAAEAAATAAQAAADAAEATTAAATAAEAAAAAAEATTTATTTTTTTAS